jgi:hypothetical protein
VEKLLEQQPQQKVTVFAVWEPILPTDWNRPITPVLARLSDRRVAQFWDKERVLAKVLAESRDPGSRPDCCVRKGVLWDLLAVYRAGAIWDQSLPAALVFNGPVVRAIVDQIIL